MSCRHFVLATLLLLAGVPAHAGVPTQIAAQGVLRDATGDLVDLPDATITFRIHDSATAGALLWSETQAVPVMMGVFDTLLPEDAQTELPTAVQTKLAIGAPLWLSIQLDGQDELPRTPLVSVPFAFTANRALMAATAGGIDCSGCIEVSDLHESVLRAEAIAFDDTLAGLGASSVQEAIDALAGQLTAHLANGGADVLPLGFGGTGSDGAFAPQADITLSGDYFYTSIHIPAGVTVTLSAWISVNLYVTGDVLIEGTLNGTGGGPGGGGGVNGHPCCGGQGQPGQSISGGNPPPFWMTRLPTPYPISGAGGTAGSANFCAGTSGSGGAAGAGLYIESRGAIRIAPTGKVLLRGIDGGNGTATCAGAGSGGGGGAFVTRSVSYENLGQVDLSGGAGGSVPPTLPGGGGSGGYQFHLRPAGP